jgi:hypothetical protein
MAKVCGDFRFKFKFIGREDSASLHRSPVTSMAESWNFRYTFKFVREADRGRERSRSQVALYARAERFRVLVDLFQRANGHPGLLFVAVKDSEVLLGAVEV